MKSFCSAGGVCWLSKVNEIKNALGILTGAGGSFAKIARTVKNKFDIFWLQTINKEKPNLQGLDSNKLRFYKKFKGCFCEEPYKSAGVNLEACTSDDHKIDMALCPTNAEAAVHS